MDNKPDKKLFLYYFMKLRNVREAAISSGIPEDKAFAEGMKILRSAYSRNNMRKLNTQDYINQGQIKAGLERLAFGSINDVVKLAFFDEPMTDKQISSLDLFNVSEIKRVKGGGIEIKLFDRQKALEKLWEIDNSADFSSSADSFYSAIVKGASAIDNTVGDD